MLILRRGLVNSLSLSPRYLTATQGLRYSRTPARNRKIMLLSSESNDHQAPVSDMPESPQDLQFEEEKAVEPVEAYREGGYHPTHIGDFHRQGRYEIVHKLGHGSYSTVWLARDHQKFSHVALKILMAHVSAINTERDIFRALSASQVNHAGRPYVLSLLDDFVISGINGDHQCLVTQLCASTLALSKENCTNRTWRFPVNAARAITAQALLGLDYIHSSGITHGDLHMGNILFKAPDLEWCSTMDLYSRLGKPQKVTARGEGGHAEGPRMPSYLVLPALILEPCDRITDSRIVIADFGEALPQTAERHQLHTPLLLRPPESFFRERLSPATDIWTLGCTIFEILSDGPLFEGFYPDGDDVLGETVSALGHLPRRWWDRWEARSEFFLEDGSWRPDIKRVQDPWFRPLSDRFRKGLVNGDGPCEFGPQELACLDALMKAMLKYEPAERMTASQAARSEWMESYGRKALTEACLTGTTRKIGQGIEEVMPSV